MQACCERSVFCGSLLLTTKGMREGPGLNLLARRVTRPAPDVDPLCSASLPTFPPSTSSILIRMGVFTTMIICATGFLLGECPSCSGSPAVVQAPSGTVDRGSLARDTPPVKPSFSPPRARRLSKDS
jgi:hypothetical protein